MNLIHEIYNHMEFNMPISCPVVNYIKQNYFPECKYEGIIYRLMVLKNREEITNDDNYYSFSKYKHTCYNIVYGLNAGFRKYVLIKEYAEGINLIELCRILLKENISEHDRKDLRHLINSYRYEYEILAKMENYDITEG